MCVRHFPIIISNRVREPIEPGRRCAFDCGREGLERDQLKENSWGFTSAAHQRALGRHLR
jgi:hypothetical protein